MQPRKQTDYKRQPAAKRTTLSRKMLRKLKYLTPVLLAAALHGETLPDAPRPHIFSLDHALYASDVTLRAFDMISTHRFMTAPCHCYREVDPIAPHTGNYAALAAFQMGFSALNVYGAERLRKHHHPRLARVLLTADIVSEAVAVGHNYYLLSNPPAPQRVISQPVVSTSRPVVYR